MKKNKFLIYLKFNWLKILGIAVGIALIITTVLITYHGFKSFASLESFSRKSLLAGMGFNIVISIITIIMFSILSGVVHYYISLGGGMSKALGGDSAEKAKVNVKWHEVIGMDEAKQDAWEIVEFLRDRAKLKTIGGTNIKGAIMIGGPGCGKTYLAKAIATEADLPFLSAVGSEFVGMIIGLGASRMKSLFRKA